MRAGTDPGRSREKPGAIYTETHTILSAQIFLITLFLFLLAIAIKSMFSIFCLWKCPLDVQMDSS